MEKPSQPRLTKTTRRQLAVGLTVLLGVCLCSTGCVRRRLMVRTNPPGALVYVDNQQIGTTPCGVDFTYYGTREIRVVKSGYETLTVNQPIPTPWYQIPGIDFFSENLVPWRIRDDRVVSFNLAPQRMVPPEELIGRAQQLRTAANQAVVPVGAMLGAPNDPFAGSSAFGPAAPPTFAPPTYSPPPSPPSSPPPLGY